ncbi:MAG: methyltransferase domain-containing protein [Acidobacteria bacterium]|nr:methyltransferase domain-containing protein [Acidobacteriota bacterium]
MAWDQARLARLLRNEADSSGRRRITTILEYLDLQSGDRVLDCGCGLGWCLNVMGELFDCALYGVDIDRARLTRAANEIGPRSQLLAASAAHLPFLDDSVDKIVLSEVLEHVADDAAVLREVYRVLRPGGVVAVTVPHRNYPFLWDPINRIRERLGRAPIRKGVLGGIWTDHLRLYDRQGLTDVVREAHLTVEDIRPLVHYCLPFAHNLVYGIGKPLVESGVLSGADRFRTEENSGTMWNPLNWALAIVNAIDRFDMARPTPEGTSVGIGLKARKALTPPR